MTVFLKVVGENIFPKLDYFNYNPKQPSRKVFNSDWAKVGEYQHEIANHFRDYQNRKKLNRYYKKRRHPLKVVFEEQACVYRDILPLNQIHFPEANNSGPYHNLFKNCYGNTLRKISTTNSISELRFLTKRQERLYKHTKVPSLTQGQPNHCTNNLNSASKRRYTSKTRKRNLQHISSNDDTNCIRLEHNHIVDDIGSNKVIWEGVSVEKCNKEEEFNDDIENCFFRLASECYDEGFLSHIKYLKSIVDRNAINNTTSKRRKLRKSTESTKLDSQSPSAVSSVSSSNSVEEFSNNVCVGRFASAVKRILKNRSIIKPNLCNNDRRDLKICVNITRSVSLESLNSSRSSGQKPQDFTRANRYIMSDFLNAAEAVVSREIVDTNSSTIKQHHFHDLIENLNKLEISDSGLLPKILISSADDNVKSSLFEGGSNDRTFLKQDSLEIDIPFFNDYYSSEARPP